MARGRFITFEGGEGAGKSTQLALLADALEHKGLTVRRTREPGGSPGAEAIRELLLHGPDHGWRALTEALLHFAARHEHVEGVVHPALADGQWVLSDRFADSTLAYQGYGLGLPRETVESLYRIVLGDFAPDLTLILDVPAEVGMARIGERAPAGDRYERMDRAFHERLQRGFREIAGADPERCVLIDASGAPEAVHRRVLKALSERLGVDPA